MENIMKRPVYLLCYLSGEMISDSENKNKPTDPAQFGL